MVSERRYVTGSDTFLKPEAVDVRWSSTDRRTNRRARRQGKLILVHELKQQNPRSTLALIGQ